jgi:TolB-like protein/Tfp pilus assembly protein PilF
MAGTSETFGSFVFERASGRLTRDGKPMHVGTRAATLLVTLLDADGGVVGKDALIEAAWPGTIVEEGNLSVQIAGLRKALGTREDGQEWIATVPRVGYRFLRHQAPVAEVPDSVGPSLAVLPFANLSGDAGQDYFADGVVEDIITGLSRFRSFAVVSRNSSFVYKGRAVDVRQVSRELGVRYVLEGSVRRAGQRLRIGAQLVDGLSGTHLWAQTFDGLVEDVFDVQDRITEGVVAVIEPQIRQAELERSRRERPQGIDAYDLYLQSLPYHYGGLPEENAQGIVLLERAVALSPTYAPALAMLADSLQHRIGMGWPSFGADDRQRCLEVTALALANAKDDATALAHCGMALITVAKDYDRGMLIMERAVAANPHSVAVATIVGVANLHCGGLDTALGHFDRALRLSPRDPTAFLPLTGIAHVHMCRDNYEEALVWAARSAAVNDAFDPSFWMLAAANAHLGRMDDARRFLVRLLEIAPGLTIERLRNGQPSKEPSRMRSILSGLKLAGLEAG